MTIKLIYGFAVSICLLQNLAYAQVKPLQVDDQIPNIIFDHIENSLYDHTTTDDLKGKIILLDFGDITCGSCVLGLTQLNALQQKYKTNLQIFWVTGNSVSQLKAFISSNRIGRSVEIAMLNGDTRKLLSNYFPDMQNPSEVWIDQTGTVKAFSDPKLVDETHINALIQHTPANWPLGKDIPYYKPGKTKNDVGEAQFKSLVSWNPAAQLKVSPYSAYETVFTGHLPGFTVDGKEYTDTASKITFYQRINMSILNIYWQLFYSLSMADTTYYRLEKTYKEAPVYYQIMVKDSSRMIDKTGKFDIYWKQNHTYCYQTSFPFGTTKVQQVKKILSDLDFYLGLRTALADREVNCWVLKRMNVNHRFEKYDVINSETENEKRVHTIGGLETYLNSIPGRTPFLDETGMKNDQYLHIEVDQLSAVDLNALNAQLARYGLVVRLLPRTVKMFVMTDANQN